MNGNETPCSAGRRGRRRLAMRLPYLAGVLLGLLVVAYVAGWMVGQEQARDLQRARQQACEADPHCLRP